MSANEHVAQAGPEIPILEPANEHLPPAWLIDYSRSIALVLFIVCAVLAITAIAGWFIGIEFMIALVPGLATMKFNTALCALLLSFSGFAHLHGRFSTQIPALIGLAVAFFLGTFNLFEYVFAVNTGVDQLFVQDNQTPADQYPGRMSQVTALGITLSSIAGAALLLKRPRLVQILAAIVAVTGLLSLIAYIFDRQAIYEFLPFSSLSINTSIVFICLGTAYLFAESEKAYLRFLYLKSTGGQVARKYLLYLLLIPFAMAGFVVLGGSLFGFSAHFGLFLLSAIICVACLYFLNRISLFVHERELAMQKAELQQKQTAERMAQLQRIESMGLVAGGIAHDFKNLLMPITWSADLGLLNIEPGDANYKRYKTILESAEKAAALAERMMQLGKQKEMKFEFVDVNQLLVGFKDILGGLSKGRVEIELTLGASLASIVADKSHIEQILINLTSNACQAMNNAGRLKIETSQCCVVAEEMRVLSSANIESGEYICVGVTDTGKGMSEEERKRSLEPFFSTKDKGVGHGLGLSNVHDIVLQHLGFLDISSSPGYGTTVRVYFPAKIHAKAHHMVHRPSNDASTEPVYESHVRPEVPRSSSHR